MPTSPKQPSQPRRNLVDQLGLKPMTRKLVWPLVILMSLLSLVGIYNLIFNTEHVASWGLLFLTPIPLYWGIASLRGQPRS